MDNEALKTLTRLEERMITVQKDIDEIKKDMVYKSEFMPVKTVVYGMVGITLTTVFGLILAYVGLN